MSAVLARLRSDRVRHYIADAARRLRRPRSATSPPGKRSKTRRLSMCLLPVSIASAAPLRPAPATLEALHAALLEPVPGGDPDAVPPEVSRLLRWLAAEAFREMFRP